MLRRAHDRILSVGPGLASKLSASLKSKAITDCLVYFSMKYRKAPMAICVAICKRSGSLTWDAASQLPSWRKQ